MYVCCTVCTYEPDKDTWTLLFSRGKITQNLYFLTLFVWTKTIKNVFTSSEVVFPNVMDVLCCTVLFCTCSVMLYWVMASYIWALIWTRGFLNHQMSTITATSTSKRKNLHISILQYADVCRPFSLCVCHFISVCLCFCGSGCKESRWHWSIT